VTRFKWRQFQKRLIAWALWLSSVLPKQARDSVFEFLWEVTSRLETPGRAHISTKRRLVLNPRMKFGHYHENFGGLITRYIDDVWYFGPFTYVIQRVIKVNVDG